VTIFPIHFPATFMTTGQSEIIEEICRKHPHLETDRKIMADAAFNEKIDIFLTTDKDLAHQVIRIGKVKFMLPSELWNYYQSAKV
jgi:hypothetical protein